MSCSYSKNKSHIYKWRENNKIKYLEYRTKYRKQQAIWMRISSEFRNILFNN